MTVCRRQTRIRCRDVQAHVRRRSDLIGADDFVNVQHSAACRNRFPDIRGLVAAYRAALSKINFHGRDIVYNLYGNGGGSRSCTRLVCCSQNKIFCLRRIRHIRYRTFQLILVTGHSRRRIISRNRQLTAMNDRANQVVNRYDLSVDGNAGNIIQTIRIK